MKSMIEIIGARENNLQNIDVKIPRDKLTVITGISGSGKSSLAFNVIFSEGQRRFLESLSAYARSRLPQLKKPDVDFIHGLSPVVSIEQKRGISNPRSTVASLTDIGSYLRLLFSVVGIARCPYCKKQITIQTKNQIAERIQSLPEGTKLEIRAALFKVYGEPYRFILDRARNQGFRRFRINGKLHDISEAIDLDEDEEFEVEAIIDTILVRGDIYKQLMKTLEDGLSIGQKFLRLEILNPEHLNNRSSKFHQDFTCPDHHYVCSDLSPWYFTPNDPESACFTCVGLGTYMRAAPFLLIEDESKSLRQGAIAKVFNISQKTYKRFNNPNALLIHSLAEHYNFSLDTPFKDLPQEIHDIIFYGTKGEKFRIILPDDSPVKNDERVGKKVSFEGLVPRIDRWYKRTTKRRTPETYEQGWIHRTMIEYPCPDCQGKKLQKHRWLVKINGKDIHECARMPLDDLLGFLEKIELSEEKKHLGEPALNELKSRLQTMIDIGLHYLNLDRRTDSLSGGELQRSKLSTQIGSGLMGMLYVLDEPSIGLHPRDSRRLINTLEKLRDLGNTVLVVEHDIDMMHAADHLIEMGPGPGIHGGKVVAEGTLEEFKKNPESLTGQYLAGTKKIALPQSKREPNGHEIKVAGARENNLRNIDVRVPLGIFICVTGVSGSGKSSLIHDILYKKLYALKRDRRIIPGQHEKLEGHEYISDVRNIDQSPIGRSPRSNPATYIGFYDRIQRLFAQTPEAKTKGYSERDFSFNSKLSGRCVECSGKGTVTTELQYMPDVESVCPACKGARFNKETLEIKYRGNNIAEILRMTVEEAMKFFNDHSYLKHKLGVLNELGLGYIELGQSSTTISGGEAQRLKLARELAKIKRKRDNLYILDEPTTGLHLADIQKLLDILNRLVDEGNTILVIEHNLDVIKAADYIIDLGPEGGKNGGEIVAQGPPEEIVSNPNSYTAQYLRRILNND
jgi:excinuclease ABC subunit A